MFFLATVLLINGYALFAVSMLQSDFIGSMLHLPSLVCIAFLWVYLVRLSFSWREMGLALHSLCQPSINEDMRNLILCVWMAAARSALVAGALIFQAGMIVYLRTMFNTDESMYWIVSNLHIMASMTYAAFLCFGVCLPAYIWIVLTPGTSDASPDDLVPEALDHSSPRLIERLVVLAPATLGALFASTGPTLHAVIVTLTIVILGGNFIWDSLREEPECKRSRSAKWMMMFVSAGTSILCIGLLFFLFYEYQGRELVPMFFFLPLLCSLTWFSNVVFPCEDQYNYATKRKEGWAFFFETIFIVFATFIVFVVTMFFVLFSSGPFQN